ncbi:hypothetical protein CROQUDRAFT_136284 [Cronartium quercuum f. sp. fusiforme G11]|uniref:Uncharacterized protein n=1 Tax=Cronartium quercuum f. sp. fusiforme G11 TaxID=708437 RepID=A0A9P6T6S8_9BASI|nr:hypothetical protein CROQUDRAFT_136284 [Cronartium quercuum f. sp. fusiforme G11]
MRGLKGNVEVWTCNGWFSSCKVIQKVSFPMDERSFFENNNDDPESMSGCSVPTLEGVGSAGFGMSVEEVDGVRDGALIGSSVEIISLGILVDLAKDLDIQ